MHILIYSLMCFESKLTGSSVIREKTGIKYDQTVLEAKLFG